MESPKIDTRSYAQIVSETEALAAKYTAWRPGTAIDAGGAMIRIFGRFAEIVIDRLNQVPEKSFLAFLNLIGVDQMPAQPARVPLTFELAVGSPVDAYVPAGTQASAPPIEGETEDVVFETERDLLVTRTQLIEVYSRAFDDGSDQDRYGHYTEAATHVSDASFPFFAGDTAMAHFLYLACEALLSLKEPTDVTIHFQTESARQLQALPISWAYWDGENETWQAFNRANISTQVAAADACTVSIKDCPPLTAREVNGVEGGWLRLQLDIPVTAPRSDLTLDAVALGGRHPSALTLPLDVFSADEDYFYLGGEAAFARRGATITLDITLPTPGTGQGLSLQLDYGIPDASGTFASWGTLEIEDGTAGLTHSGQIRFQVPPDGSWRVASRYNQASRWCRFTRVGAYTQSPQIGGLIVVEDWQLPTIQDIRVQLPDNRPALLPTHGFSNSLTLDLTKDFYPFGQEPRFNDTFYLAYGHLISEGGMGAGDRIHINVELTQAGIAGGTNAETGQVSLIWEFWNGRKWEMFEQSTTASGSPSPSAYDFQDKTSAFTSAGTIECDLPATAAANVVNGVEDHWLRARIKSGDYGQDARYEAYSVELSGSTITSYRLVEANFAPPIIAALSFDVSAKSAFPVSACLSYNNFAYVDHTRTLATATTGFVPFTPTPDTEPTLYLGFDRPFANRMVTLYTQVLPPTPEQVLPSEFQTKAYDDPPQLVWEYARDGGWTRLGIIDETNAFADRGLIRFIGPKYFTSRQMFGQSLYWLRVRWQGGQFPIAPQCLRLSLNTTWAAQATTIHNESLGSSSGNPNQSFQTAQQPILPGQLLEVREPDLNETQLAQFQADHATTIFRNDAGTITEAWIHWQEAHDFYTSGPTDRHYTLDHITGTIRFGDGVNGMIPPAGQGNIRLAQYRNGGGLQGNRDQGAIVQLKSTIPYVNGVINHEPAAGGAARESLDSVKRYGPRTLRHRGRAVTQEDIEDLAFEASSMVARARAVPPQFRPLDLWLDPGQASPNLSQHRDVEEAGRLGLIIVPNSAVPQPVPSPELLDRIRTTLLARIDSTVDLWISGPDWMQVIVAATIVPTSLEAANFVGEHVSEALAHFLHPLTGGYAGKGWTFGRRPYRSDLYTLIESVEGVDYVLDLSVTETPEATMLQAERFLIYSGQHDITVTLDKIV